MYMYWDTKVQGYVKYDPATYKNPANAAKNPTAVNTGASGSKIGGKAKQVERDMDKWFKRKQKEKRSGATADGLRSADFSALQKTGTSTPDNQGNLSAAELAQIALSNAAAKLAAQSNAGSGMQTGNPPAATPSAGGNSGAAGSGANGWTVVQDHGTTAAE